MDIKAQQVVPIVGPELAVLQAMPGKPTLYEYLAQELAARLDIAPHELGATFNLLEVSAHYLDKPGNRPEDLICFLANSSKKIG